jgi:hypothetical protein
MEGVKIWTTNYTATISLSRSLLLIELECNYTRYTNSLCYLIPSDSWEDIGQWPAYYTSTVLSLVELSWYYSKPREDRAVAENLKQYCPKPKSSNIHTGRVFILGYNLFFIIYLIIYGPT